MKEKGLVVTIKIEKEKIKTIQSGTVKATKHNYVLERELTEDTVELQSPSDFINGILKDYLGTDIELEINVKVKQIQK